MDEIHNNPPVILLLEDLIFGLKDLDLDIQVRDILDLFLSFLEELSEHDDILAWHGIAAQDELFNRSHVHSLGHVQVFQDKDLLELFLEHVLKMDPVHFH